MPCKCSMCEKQLAGGKETYGDFGFPLCWDCFHWWADEEKAQAEAYRIMRDELARELQDEIDLHFSMYRTVPYVSPRTFKPYAYLS